MKQAKKPEDGGKIQNKALLIIDMQNDFCAGSMAVEDSEKLVPIINDLRQRNTFHFVFRTRDWHPKDHISF